MDITGVRAQGLQKDYEAFVSDSTSTDIKQQLMRIIEMVNCLETSSEQRKVPEKKLWQLESSFMNIACANIDSNNQVRMAVLNRAFDVVKKYNQGNFNHSSIILGLACMDDEEQVRGFMDNISKTMADNKQTMVSSQVKFTNYLNEMGLALFDAKGDLAIFGLEAENPSKLHVGIVDHKKFLAFINTLDKEQINENLKSNLEKISDSIWHKFYSAGSEKPENLLELENKLEVIEEIVNKFQELEISKESLKEVLFFIQYTKLDSLGDAVKASDNYLLNQKLEYFHLHNWHQDTFLAEYKKNIDEVKSFLEQVIAKPKIRNLAKRCLENAKYKIEAAIVDMHRRGFEQYKDRYPIASDFKDFCEEKLQELA